MTARWKRLTPKQRSILERIADGSWELGAGLDFAGRRRMQEGGLGRGGTDETVPTSTFIALRDNGLIEMWERKFPLARYRITDKGREALKQ